MNRDERWRLYEHALALVDRHIDRQWSLTQFFILLNASVIGGAIALLQMGKEPVARGLVVLAFLGGCGLSVAGIRAMSQAKKYYRTMMVKKTLLERELGLLKPFFGAEATQAGIRSLGGVATRKKVDEMLRDVDGYVRPRVRRGSITDWSRWTLAGFLVFDLAAAIAVSVDLIARWPA